MDISTTTLIVGLVCAAGAVLTAIFYACLVAGKLADMRMEWMRHNPPPRFAEDVKEAGYYWVQRVARPHERMIMTRLLFDYDAGGELVTLGRQPVNEAFGREYVLYGPIPRPEVSPAMADAEGPRIPAEGTGAFWTREGGFS